jgi:hypothetical protein
MKTKLLLTTAALLLSSGAMASVLEIGLQEAGFNGGAITTETVGAPPGASITDVPYGTFAINSVDANEAGSPGVNLSGTSINVSGTDGHTLNIFVTETGITEPLTNWASGLTTNLLPRGWSVTERTFIDNSDVAYGTATLLDSATFTAIGDQFGTKAANGIPLYSVTEEFSVSLSSSAAFGHDDSTITLAGSIPETKTWAMMLSGFAFLGFVGLNKRRSMRLA